jgi:hypothetical protein
MATTFSTIEVPHYHSKPFFSSIFRCPIAIGSFFIFRTPNNHSKQVVARIVSARKSVEEDDKEDHAVTVNLFLSFDEWPGSTTMFPIEDGMGKNLQEAVLTCKTAEFHFDRDVDDIAFLFTTFELVRRGAILIGKENLGLCSC